MLGLRWRLLTGITVQDARERANKRIHDLCGQEQSFEFEWIDPRRWNQCSIQRLFNVLLANFGEEHGERPLIRLEDGATGGLGEERSHVVVVVIVDDELRC